MAATDLQARSPSLVDSDLIDISESNGSSPRAVSPQDEHEADEGEPSVEASSPTQEDEAGDQSNAVQTIAESNTSEDTTTTIPTTAEEAEVLPEDVATEPNTKAPLGKSLTPTAGATHKSRPSVSASAKTASTSALAKKVSNQRVFW